VPGATCGVSARADVNAAAPLGRGCAVCFPFPLGTQAVAAMLTPAFHDVMAGRSQPYVQVIQVQRQPVLALHLGPAHVRGAKSRSTFQTMFGLVWSRSVSGEPG